MPWELLGTRTFCACATAICDKDCQIRTPPAPGLFNPHVAAIPAAEITLPLLIDALGACNSRSAPAAKGIPTIVFVVLHDDLILLLAAWLSPVLSGNYPKGIVPPSLVIVLVTILAKIQGAMTREKSRGIRRFEVLFKCISPINHTTIAADAERQGIRLLSPSNLAMGASTPPRSSS
jgi:hypothetical protein